MRAFAIAFALATILLGTGLAAVTLPGPAAAQNASTDQSGTDEQQESFEWSCNVLRCTFSAANLSTADDNATYQWDFDDNSTGLLGETVEHLYQNPGTYNVTLTFTGADGSQQTYTEQIHVEADRGNPDAVPWSALIVGFGAFAGSIAIARLT